MNKLFSGLFLSLFAMGFVAFSTPRVAVAAPRACSAVLAAATANTKLDLDLKPPVNLEELLSKSGFPGEAFFELFSTDHKKSAQNISAWIQKLKPALKRLSPDKIEKLKTQIKIAESVFKKYLDEPSNSKLAILKIAVEGKSGVTDWISSLKDGDSLRQNIQWAALFIFEWNPQLLPFANLEIAQSLNRARKTYAPTTSRMGLDFYLPPRRAMTFALKILNHWPEQIINDIKSSKPPLLAYKNFLKDSNNVARLAGPTYGQFEFNAVWNIAKDIQTALQKWPTKRKESFVVSIDGSFANGLAQNKLSDIDLFYSHTDLENFISASDLEKSFTQTFERLGYQGLPLQIQDVAAQLPPSLRSRADLMAKLAEIGTTSLVISANEIQLVVFPTDHRDMQSFILTEN